MDLDWGGCCLTPLYIPGAAYGAQSVCLAIMDYLKIFLITMGAFTQQVFCRPGFGYYGQGYHQQHSILEFPLFQPHDTLVQSHLAPEIVHDHHYSGHSNALGHNHILPVVLPSGHLADTPEVAAAKIHHLGAVAQAKADKYYSGHAESGYGGAYGYSGSINGYAVPVVLPNGHIADTQEVAAAKSAHLLAVAKTRAEQYYSSHGEGYGGAYGYSGSHHGYGIPVVLPNGHIADTHEVAVAKNAHLMAVAYAKAREGLHYDHLQDYHEYPHHEPLYVSVSDDFIHSLASPQYTPLWFSSY